MKIKSLMNTLVVFIAILLFCSDTFGQSADTLRYKFNLQVGGQRKTGVFSQTSVRAIANTKIDNKKLHIDNLSSYTYTEVNDFNIADDWHFKTIGVIKLDSATRFLPLFGHNYLKNVLFRIVNSNRLFAGVRIVPVKHYHDLSFAVGGGYEFTHYTDEFFENSTLVSNQRDFAIGFINLLGKHNLWKNKILLEYNISYVQSFEEATDFSSWATSGISVPLGNHLFLGVNYEFRYRNVHLVDLPNLNDLLLFNIRFNFSN